MRALDTTVHMSSAYHSQTRGQTERLNQCLEMYLRYMARHRPMTWAKWLLMAEWWYTSYHTSLKMTHFHVFYDFVPPNFLEVTEVHSASPSVEELMADCQTAARFLRQQLQQAQCCIKHFSDKKIIERHFHEGDSMAATARFRGRRISKLSLRFYEPFEVLHKVGPVAYKLKLPPPHRYTQFFMYPFSNRTRRLLAFMCRISLLVPLKR